MPKALTIEDYENCVNAHGVKWVRGQELPQNCNSKTKWICSCGNEFEGTWSKVIKRNDRCGCRGKKIIDGQKFGMLTAIKEAAPLIRNGQRYERWECVCDCGKTKVISRNHLVSGTTISCGCQLVSNKKGLDSNFYTGGKYVTGQKWSELKHSAKRRNIEFDITLEYVESLLEEQHFKCAITDLDINTIINSDNKASLDRKDNNKGYVIGNLQWVNKHVNFMKRDLTEKQFIELCCSVADNYRNSIYEG